MDSTNFYSLDWYSNLDKDYQKKVAEKVTRFSKAVMAKEKLTTTKVARRASVPTTAVKSLLDGMSDFEDNREYYETILATLNVPNYMINPANTWIMGSLHVWEEEQNIVWAWELIKPSFPHDHTNSYSIALIIMTALCKELSRFGKVFICCNGDDGFPFLSLPGKMLVKFDVVNKRLSVSKAGSSEVYWVDITDGFFNLLILTISTT